MNWSEFEKFLLVVFLACAFMVILYILFGEENPPPKPKEENCDGTWVYGTYMDKYGIYHDNTYCLPEK